MPHYLDTSAFLKLVVDEEHSDELRAFVALPDYAPFSSDLLRTEGLRAARRHSPAALLRARSIMDAVTLVSITPTMCERAAELDPSILRTLDAIHLATALALADQLESVITYDARLAEACSLHGVPVIAPQAGMPLLP